MDEILNNQTRELILAVVLLTHNELRCKRILGAGCFL